MESTFLSLLLDFLRTVLAVKGSLRRAKLRRALDGSGPFRRIFLTGGKREIRKPAASSVLPGIGRHRNDAVGTFQAFPACESDGVAPQRPRRIARRGAGCQDGF